MPCRISATLAAFMMLVSFPAAAQGPVPPQHGYVVGVGGLSATQVNSPFFGASAGFNLTPDLLLTVDVGRMQDVQADFTKEDLASLDQGMTAGLGFPFTSTIKMPTNYFTGGVRYILPLRSTIRPYVSGSGGIAHMSPEINFAALGLDMTGILQSDPELQPYLATPFREETRPMATVGTGVVFTVVRHLTFDIGYKYSGIFVNKDYMQLNGISPHNHDMINTHRIYTGVGVTF
jgi:opacity protein-like surface antigen